MIDLLKHLGVSPRVLNKFWKDFIHLLNGSLKFLSIACFIHQGVYHGQPANKLKMDGICSFISLQDPEIRLYKWDQIPFVSQSPWGLRCFPKHLRDLLPYIVINPVFFKNASKEKYEQISWFLSKSRITIPITTVTTLPFPPPPLGCWRDVWFASIPTTMGLGHLEVKSMNSSL